MTIAWNEMRMGMISLTLVWLTTISGVCSAIALMVAIPFLNSQGSIFHKTDTYAKDGVTLWYHKGDLRNICDGFIDRPMIAHHMWIFCTALMTYMHMVRTVHCFT
jgi:hypothetical protein